MAINKDENNALGGNEKASVNFAATVDEKNQGLKEAFSPQATPNGNDGNAALTKGDNHTARQLPDDKKEKEEREAGRGEDRQAKLLELIIGLVTALFTKSFGGFGKDQEEHAIDDAKNNALAGGGKVTQQSVAASAQKVAGEQQVNPLSSLNHEAQEAAKNAAVSSKGQINFEEEKNHKITGFRPLHTASLTPPQAESSASRGG